MFRRLTGEVFDIERDGVVIESDYATTTYSDTGLTPNTSYTYRVRAVDGTEAFDPDSITGLVGWYDFSDATTLYTDTGMTTLVSADGNTIKGVNDKSSTNHDVTHATGCTYKVSIKNSLSVARFNGTSQVLGPTSITQAQPVTLIAVMQSTLTDTQNRVIVGSGTSVSTFGRGSTATPSPWRIYSGATFEPGGTVAAATWGTIVGYANGASSKMYLDGGTSLGTGNAGAAGWNNWHVGSYDGASQFWEGDIGEVLIYDSALSVADLNSIGEYLEAKWNITWTTAT